MRAWTVQDEINLCKWVDDRGFKLVYIPQVVQWHHTQTNEASKMN